MSTNHETAVLLGELMPLKACPTSQSLWSQVSAVIILFY